MIETEAKIKIEKEDLERIISLVGPVEFNLQKNRYYYFSDGLLRIRNENGKSVLTYKGRPKKSKYNAREEVECMIKDVENLEKIFDLLGFKDNFYYEKNRASFQLNNCIVCIDKLSNNDIYVEIEGNDEDISKNIDYLGFNDKKNESRSYPEILNGLHRKNL